LNALAFAFLFLGGFVYLLWRPTGLLMFRWCDRLGWLDEIETARQRVAGLVADEGWIMGSFPHGAWTFAGTTLLGLLWRSSPGLSARLWSGSIPAVSIFGELGQIAGTVPGRFDHLDLLTALSASTFALLLVSARTSTSNP
jgi:hypothetical protein